MPPTAVQRAEALLKMPIPWLKRADLQQLKPQRSLVEILLDNS